MKTVALLCGIAIGLTMMASAGSTSQPAQASWFRGNLHSHSVNSDGDSPPADLMAWYKRNGYHFLAITDHNTFTDPAPYDTNPGDSFLLLGGEEITNAKTVHVNAIGIAKAIPEQPGATVPALLQASIDAVRAQGGIALINHPNFLWAFTAKEMSQVKGAGLLEIASGHPLVNHDGDGRVPSTEQMWDELLTGGMRIFGAAVDDSHNFREEFSIDRANPGRAWITVRAAALSREAILAAINAGDFYASTGVTLTALDVSRDALEIAVAAAPSQRYRVVFVGAGGQVLATSYDNPARYDFAGNERYVRARIEESSGRRAWTQPVFRAATW
jgi:hypothetical protein